MNASAPVIATISGPRTQEAAPEPARCRSEAASGCTISQPLCAFRAVHGSNTDNRSARIVAASMLSDPAATAWVVAGRPAVDAPTPVPGRCGRCGEDVPTVASRHVISEKFTNFDDWPFGSRRLCVPCAWAYSRSPAAVPAMMITAATVTEHPKGIGLAAVLAAGPLAHTHAVVLPTSHRRHILATAQWGHVATDGLVTAWDAAAAARLADLAMLRPVVSTIWASVSSSGTASALASRRPMVDLPEPGIPTSTALGAMGYPDA